MDSLPSKAFFVMAEVAKLTKAFVSKCDHDLTMIYEVIKRGSSNISTGLYAKWCSIYIMHNNK